MRVRTATRLDAFKGAIGEMLRTDLDAPRKQRHTPPGFCGLRMSMLRLRCRIRRSAITYADGTRALIDVLLHRTMSKDDVVAGILGDAGRFIRDFVSR